MYGFLAYLALLAFLAAAFTWPGPFFAVLIPVLILGCAISGWREGRRGGVRAAATGAAKAAALVIVAVVGVAVLGLAGGLFGGADCLRRNPWAC